MALFDRIAHDMQLMFRRPTRIQYGALCYRVRKKGSGAEALLITSRDTGRWVIPKGWPMDGKLAYQAAEREAYEEAGVKGEIGREPIGVYTYRKGMDFGVTINCKVQVYPLVVEDIAKNFPEKDMRRSEWMSFAEAAKRVEEPLLKTLILSFAARISSAYGTREDDGIA
ncbi:NUDIX hydrolase [Ensifer soli]|uniref:NUDIX hydrolase n=1 Tax=Ciceribacter sp. sgz301302 TaxID=3342379 RepID=UPI0035BA6C9A